MRRYDDPVEVRRGMVGQAGRQVEAPEQFLWRGTLWKVREVIAHWVETGPWWQSAGVSAAIGTSAEGDGAGDRSGSVLSPGVDLLDERELWRVEAGSGMASGLSGMSIGTDGRMNGGGVFDLAFSWTDGTWQLLGCTD